MRNKPEAKTRTHAQCVLPFVPNLLRNSKYAWVAWVISTSKQIGVVRAFEIVRISFRKMAIIGSSDNGFLVDHKKSISDSVSEQSLACKDYLFALFEPYFRPSDETGRGTRKRKVRSPICGKHTLILTNLHSL